MALWFSRQLIYHCSKTCLSLSLGYSKASWPRWSVFTVSYRKEKTTNKHSIPVHPTILLNSSSQRLISSFPNDLALWRLLAQAEDSFSKERKSFLCGQHKEQIKNSREFRWFDRWKQSHIQFCSPQIPPSATLMFRLIKNNHQNFNSHEKKKEKKVFVYTSVAHEYLRSAQSLAL